MPLFLGVRCVCGAFQVIQAPKNKKFDCRVCGAKRQSVRKVFARSDAAKEVREVVMALSMSRAAGDAAPPCEEWEGEGDSAEEEEWEEEAKPQAAPTVSKWAAFVAPEPQSRVEEEEDDQYTTEAVGVERGRRARKRKEAGEATVPKASKRSFPLAGPVMQPVTRPPAPIAPLALPKSVSVHAPVARGAAGTAAAPVARGSPAGVSVTGASVSVGGWGGFSSARAVSPAVGRGWGATVAVGGATVTAGGATVGGVVPGAAGGVSVSAKAVSAPVSKWAQFLEATDPDEEGAEEN